jgi:hypothetical protein
MELLPSELVYHIQGYVTLIEKFKISRVSKTWNQIVMIDKQYQTVLECVKELNRNTTFKCNDIGEVDIYNGNTPIATINISRYSGKFIFFLWSDKFCGTIVFIKDKTYYRTIDKTTNLDGKIMIQTNRKFEHCPIDQKIVKLVITLLLHIK